MLNEVKLWRIAGKILLAGSLIAAGCQPMIVNAAQSIEANHKTQSAHERKSVSIILDGKPLNHVTGFFQDDTVWVPVTAFSKAAGMKIDYQNEKGIKEWTMTYRQNEITDQVSTFSLHVDSDDIYLITGEDFFFRYLKVIQGVVYIPVKALAALTKYDSLYNTQNQNLYMTTSMRSQDQAIAKLVFAYLKDYEHVNEMNLKLYHPDYLDAQSYRKSPYFLNSFQPGVDGNSIHSKITISGIKIYSLKYNNLADEATVKLKYDVFNDGLPIHAHVNSKVWLTKLNGNWTVKLILDTYTSQINEDILQKRTDLQQTEPDVINNVKDNATQYYQAWSNSDVKRVGYWTNFIDAKDANENQESKEQFEQDTKDWLPDPDRKKELLALEVVDIMDDTAFVTVTVYDYNIHDHDSEPVVEKKLSQFKKMQDGRWGFDADIAFIDETMQEANGYTPAYTRN